MKLFLIFQIKSDNKNVRNQLQIETLYLQPFSDRKNDLRL